MSDGQLAYYELQAESSGWLFKPLFAGGGAYCVGTTTCRTACYYH